MFRVGGWMENYIMLWLKKNIYNISTQGHSTIDILDNATLPISYLSNICI